MKPAVAQWALAVLVVLQLPAFAQELPADIEHLPLPIAIEPSQSSGPPALAVDADAAPVAEAGSGLASWYGPRFHGRRTASGERFDMHALTAAHPWLPFGTIVRVEIPATGRSVDVRINDRGPHIKQRIIDLSRAAARALGLLDSGEGTHSVVLKILKPGN